MRASPTPLPRWPVATLCLIHITEPLNFSVLFPFVYFMVKDIHPADPKQVGFYVGLITSAFALAQLLTSFFWGLVADTFGRRPVLLVGTLGAAVTMVMFGVSPSLHWAITARVVCGALNGNLATAKTVMAEITDESNQVEGFSLLPLMWIFGLVVGPALGGLLARPAVTYPGLFGHMALFVQFPYLLPCLVCAILNLVAWSGVFYLVKETLDRRDDAVTPAPNSPPISAARSATVPTRNFQTATEYGGEHQALLTRPSHDTLSDHQSASPVSPPARPNSCTAVTAPNIPALASQPSRLSSLAFSPMTRKVILGNFFIALVSLVLDEIYPIWAAYKLGLDTRAIGTTLSLSAALLLAFQLLVFPRLQRRWGLLRCFKVGTLSLLVACQAFPLIGLLEETSTPQNANRVTLDPSVSGRRPGPLTWAALMVALVGRMCAGSLSFTSIIMLVNNSVTDPRYLGTVNGMSQAANSLARTLGPVVGGQIWSWSLVHDLPFPFDYRLVFVFASVPAFLAYWTARKWDPRLNHRQSQPTTKIPTDISPASLDATG
ncbi:hypothetical protein IWQ60_006539 [Tieghemiomyces parasiticus]|uniref:Major facilitator superfamily (MFS) profile domain-containing protein n=1 Tax=Tieghemiomyces parasiticus TaxID=78921 RepID=A0A9W8A723_9FUNG|nr:hypothetical protein IWQ60_006539 [Tieghemiomyces parasiticus]